MEITLDYLMGKLKEYTTAEEQYTRLATANQGAAEAIKSTIKYLTTTPEVPSNVVPFSAPQDEQEDHSE